MWAGKEKWKDFCGCNIVIIQRPTCLICKENVTVVKGYIIQKQYGPIERTSLAAAYIGPGCKEKLHKLRKKKMVGFAKKITKKK